MADDRLVAWIRQDSDDTVVAAYVGAAAADSRPPAELVCGSREGARAWVEGEAAALGLDVDWVAGPEIAAARAGDFNQDSR